MDTKKARVGDILNFGDGRYRITGLEDPFVKKNRVGVIAVCISLPDPNPEHHIPFVLADSDKMINESLYNRETTKRIELWKKMS